MTGTPRFLRWFRILRLRRLSVTAIMAFEGFFFTHKMGFDSLDKETKEATWKYIIEQVAPQPKRKTVESSKEKNFRLIESISVIDSESEPWIHPQMRQGSFLMDISEEGKLGNRLFLLSDKRERGYIRKISPLRFSRRETLSKDKQNTGHE